MRERFRQFLSRLFYQRRVPASLLLYGKEGIGKRDIAFEFASSLLCLQEKYPPCGECESCFHMKDFKEKKEEELAFYGEDKRGNSKGASFHGCGFRDWIRQKAES